MALIGYARVSTDGQSLDAQVAELKAAGAAIVHDEKMSGAITEPAALRPAMAATQAGDVLLVTRLDRLARRTRDLLNILDVLGKKGVDFRSLRDAWDDTTTPHGRLMLTVLGGLAIFERELIKTRTGEGRQRAKGRRPDGSGAKADAPPATRGAGPTRAPRIRHRYRPILRDASRDHQSIGARPLLNTPGAGYGRRSAFRRLPRDHAREFLVPSAPMSQGSGLASRCQYDELQSTSYRTMTCSA